MADRAAAQGPGDVRGREVVRGCSDRQADLVLPVIEARSVVLVQGAADARHGGVQGVGGRLQGLLAVAGDRGGEQLVGEGEQCGATPRTPTSSRSCWRWAARAPQIVTADNGDRLGLIAEDLAEAAFFAMGQNCSAGSRILIHSSLLEEFAGELVAVAEKAVIGDPQDPATTLGPLIEADALERVTRYVDEAVASGAVARTGGARVLESTGGYLYPPTVLTSVTPDMPVAREEIFGPVVVLIPFETVDEAIEIANDSPYGLAATVWSHDVDTALRIAREVRAGTIGVNGYSEGDISTPFGGYKQSGFGGRDNGLEALQQYTETKTIWITLR